IYLNTNITTKDIQDTRYKFKDYIFPNVREKHDKLIHEINEKHNNEVETVFDFGEDFSLTDELLGWSYPFFYRLSYHCGMIEEVKEIKRDAEEYTMFSILEQTLLKELEFLDQIRSDFSDCKEYNDLRKFLMRTKQNTTQYKNKVLQQYNEKRRDLLSLMGKNDNHDSDDEVFILN
ncbi:hypothetical protein KY321_04335, partial [Candidatus Woesearchaeota archaeon]|nr:hypothetical protein [Candidatus Woesearchaeota archaeon]